jgi:uncharacterized membrane protein YkvA (DUF1232 family)
MLLLLGRGRDASEVARFIPDCIVLFSAHSETLEFRARAKLAIGLLVPYLAMPFDLIPDFIPVLGYLDDALLVAAVFGIWREVQTAM